MLSPASFWARFSRLQFDLRSPPELPERLGFAALFDQIQGRLTRHKIEQFTKQGCRIRCFGCRYADQEQNDVCETHFGILQGQLERRFSQAFDTKRRAESGVCELSFYVTTNEE